ncbi:MAG TPA: glycosyltransferase [Candidatus Saccharimonadales bacterium]|nr:glycosyltransferase [Candidatus Saccharimonadales bacterium]
MKPSKPLVTVAIPTLGRDAVLVDTIKQVLQQDFDGFELIIIDQTVHHDAATQQFLVNCSDPRFRYYLVAPPSLPAARNFATAHARGNIIVFIDDDVVLDPHFIRAHYQAFAHDPAIVAVGGRVINKVDTQPLTKQPLGFDRYARGNGNSFNCATSQPGSSFPGGNMSIKLAALQSAGGFDTSFQRSAVREESDLATRLIKAGGKIWFEADASLLHLAAPAGGTRVVGHPFDGRSFYDNDLLFALKTVRLGDLPVSLTKRYADAVRNQSLPAILRRTSLFAVGLTVAIRRRWWPSHIIAQEVAA